MRPRDALRVALLAALAAAAGLSAAGLAYQYAEAGHGGSSPGGGVALPADVLGVVLAIAFTLQLLAAYRLFAASPRSQARAHRRIAPAVLAVVAAHGAAATAHALRPPVDRLPVVLVFVGLAAAGALAVQLTTGYRQARAPRMRPIHRVVVLLATSAALAHVVLGTVHAVTG